MFLRKFMIDFVDNIKHSLCTTVCDTKRYLSDGLKNGKGQREYKDTDQLTPIDDK